MKVSLLKIISLASYFALMINLIIWITVVPHGEDYPTAAFLIIGIVPMLFPLRGLLHGKPYTHVWASFLMLFYFTHGIGELYSSEFKAIFPWLEVSLSALCFTAMILFVKQNAKTEIKIT